jgi:hypothetical protein
MGPSGVELRSVLRGQQLGNCPRSIFSPCRCGAVAAAIRGNVREQRAAGLRLGHIAESPRCLRLSPLRGVARQSGVGPRRSLAIEAQLPEHRAILPRPIASPRDLGEAGWRVVGRSCFASCAPPPGRRGLRNGGAAALGHPADHAKRRIGHSEPATTGGFPSPTYRAGDLGGIGVLAAAARRRRQKGP